MAADRDITKGIVPADVLQYWRAKGYKPRFSYLDVYSHEESIGFGAAKLLRKDVLVALRHELDKAIADGLPYEQFIKNIKPRFEAMGLWRDDVQVSDPMTGKVVAINPPARLQTIFQTNVRTARAQGQYERQIRTARTRPYLVWMLGASEKHRPEHVALEGLCLPVDHSFWQTAYPPCKWLCKCFTRSVSKREFETLLRDGITVQGEPILDEEGLPTGHHTKVTKPIQTKVPDAPLVEHHNPRTGAVIVLPDYVHPSFASNPANRREQAIQDGLKEDE